MSAVPVPAARPPVAALDLNVGGVCLEFRAPPGLALEPPGFEYPAFLVPRPAGRRICVTVERDPPPALPGATRLVFDTGDGWQLHAHGPRRWLSMPRRAAADGQPSGTVLWQVHWSEPLREARLWAAPELRRQGTLRHVIQYPLDQILITHALLAQSGLLLHAAGAVTATGAVAFAGVSGAGKSTITRLLRAGDGLTFASDDRVVVAPAAGGYALHGTPWAGDARVAEPLHAPLSALCFLRQASAPALTPLEPRVALDRLLPVTTLPWFDAAGIGAALDTAAALVSAVPCYELAFGLDARATRNLLGGLHGGR